MSVLGSDRTADKLEQTIACPRCRCASGRAKRPQQECAAPESAAAVLPPKEQKRWTLAAQRGRKGEVIFGSRARLPCPPAGHAAPRLGSSGCVWSIVRPLNSPHAPVCAPNSILRGRSIFLVNSWFAS